MHARTALGLVSTLLLLGACDVLGGWDDTVEDAEELIDDTRDSVDQAAIARAIEDEVTDYLTCSGELRPSTLARIQALLHDPGYDTLIDLVTAPDDLAQLVALAGLEVEGAVILLQNIRLLYEQGHLQALIADGWDSVELSCDSVLTLACTAGTGSSQVHCDASDQVTGIALSFSDCMLQGTKFAGGVAVDRPGGDDSAAAVAFAALTFDEVQELAGAAVLDLSAGSSAQSLALETGDQLTLTAHGGPDSGLSCGERTSLESFALSHSDGEAVAVFAGQLEKPDETYGLRTLDQHLRFAAPFDCACPESGSALELTLPDPVPGSAQSGTVRVRFAAPTESGLCASVQAEVVAWPTSCGGVEHAGADCGAAATERVVQDLLGAFCTAL